LQQCEDMWYRFFTECLEICSGSIGTLLGSPQRELELKALPEAVFEELMERAFAKIQEQAQSGVRQAFVPSPLDMLVRFLIPTKGCTSVFELLIKEKKRARDLYKL
jgi:hypothetical protein